MKSILVGVDGSEGSAHAATWALAEAQRHGARLQVLLAWEVPPPTEYYQPDPVALEAEAKDRLHSAIRQLGPTDVEIDARTALGPAARTLLEAATDTDLVVVGSRGHGAFVGMLLGSVSLHVVSQASGDVVVVPPPRDD